MTNDLDSMKKAELLETAAELGVEVSESTKKADIIAAIESAEGTSTGELTPDQARQLRKRRARRRG